MCIMTFDTEERIDDPLPIRENLNDFPPFPKPNLRPETMIPLRVVADIIMVYEFGRTKDIDRLPNNLISKRDGSFWTTWDFVIQQRERIKEIRRETESGKR